MLGFYFIDIHILRKRCAKIKMSYSRAKGLNRHPLFGPQSSITLTPVGDSKHTYHHRSHKLITSKVY